MKKVGFVVFTILALIGLIGLFLTIKELMEPASVSLIKDREEIKKLMNQSYPSHEVVHIELEYTDWSSTVAKVDKYNKATSAIVALENNEEQRMVFLKKKFLWWTIYKSYPNSGPNIPNDLYFVEMNTKNVGRAVDDIEKYIEKGGYWIIPEEGKNYKIYGTEDSWYYSFKYCENIYKTKDGKVYIFNKEKADWEESTETYSRLCYFSNFDEVDKEYALQIIKKYSSYQENDVKLPIGLENGRYKEN